MRRPLVDSATFTNTNRRAVISHMPRKIDFTQFSVESRDKRNFDKQITKTEEFLNLAFYNPLILSFLKFNNISNYMRILNLFFVFIFTGLSSTILAQEYAVDKKATWISLTGSYMSSGGELFEDSFNNKTTTSSLSSSVSHFVAKNFFIGGGVTSSNQSSGGSNARSFSIGPFIGFAFGNSKNTAYPYIDLGLSYHKISLYKGYNSNTDAAGRDLFSDFGVVFPLNSHIGLTFEVGLHAMKLKMQDSSTSKSGNIVSLSAGFAGLIF